MKKKKRKISPKAIAKIKDTKYKSKWNHPPTELIRLPQKLIPFLKAIAQELDEELNERIFNDKYFAIETIWILLKNLPSEKLIYLQKELEELIPQKEREEKELKRKQEYRIEIKEQEIAVYSPYDKTGERQEICRSIEGYRFDGDDKSWNYPFSSIVEILDAFCETDYWWKDEQRLNSLYREEKQRREKEEEQQKKEAEVRQKQETKRLLLFEKAIEHYKPKIDESLANGWQLRNYQKDAVNWLIHRQKGGVYPGGILADDMGLGKTIEALFAAKLLQSHHQCHVFVISPVSLLENWQREAERVGVEIEIFSNHYSKIPQPVSSPYIAIADEAHCFQNPKSARTSKIKELVLNENCIASWLLTGTPIKNGSPINLYPLLEMCQHKLAENKNHYIDFFCAPVQRKYGKKSFWDITGSAHLDELSAKTNDVILRRTKKECLKELPEKTRLYKDIELGSKEKKTYSKKLKELLEDYRKRAKAGEVDKSAEALVTINYLRRLNSEYKIPTAIEIIEELLEQNQQVVVFTEFVESAKALYEQFEGISELLIGKTKDRQGAVDRFQAGDSKIFIGTIKAGGVGITLTAASNVILVDRPWTPGDAEQAEDRCYRLGQQNAVFINWLRLGIVDESIDKLIDRKQRNIDLVLAGKDRVQKIKSFKEFAEKLLDNL